MITSAHYIIRLKIIGKIMHLITFIFLLCLVLTVPNAKADSEVNILVTGTWGLEPHPDPFINRYPVVDYLPPGTVIFKINKSRLPGYSEVLTHFGHSLLVKEMTDKSTSDSPVKIYRSIEGLVNVPPTDALLLHESILCLGQTNRLVIPPNRCDKFGHHSMSILPVGKGWLYKFKEKKDSKWVELSLNLDEKTKAQLERRGIKPEEANFLIAKNDLLRLERQGYLTMLNKNHPLVVFEYLNDEPLYIKCGQKKVTHNWSVEDLNNSK